MSVYFLWGSIGLIVFAMLIGFLVGLRRGLKRSSLHLLFFVTSMVFAYFLTRPIANAVLSMSFQIDGQKIKLNEIVLSFLKDTFDLSGYANATAFLKGLPGAVICPVLFILVAIVFYLIFNIIYLIVARLSFGKKKKDFETHKPRRLWGAGIGAVEAFIFVYLIFAPLTALTGLYSDLTKISDASATIEALAENSDSEKLQPLGKIISEKVSTGLDEGLKAYNNSALGVICGAGGLDNALFDGLSNFKVDGVKIKLRSEILTLAETYDNFAEQYNLYVDKNYEDMELSKLKKSLEKVLNNGIFKAVLSETVKDLVLNYDFQGNSLDLPDLAKDIMTEVKTKFGSEDFDAHTYLKNDILKVVDIAETIVENDLIEKFENLDDKSAFEVLEFVNENSTAVKAVTSDVFAINLFNDSFTALGETASKALEESLADENSENLDISLNMEIENKNQVVEDLLLAIDKLLVLNEEIGLQNLLDSEKGGLTEAFSQIEDVESVFTQAGEALDTVRNLAILVKGEGAEKTYVLDNLLKIYGASLLGDSVTQANGQKKEINTYAEFFNHLKTPVTNAKKAGILEFENLNFDNVLDSILKELKTNSKFLAETIMPFYELSAFDLKTLVFDELITQLQENADMIDLANIEDNYASWKQKFEELGKILNKLNAGKVGAEEKTYIKYLLAENPDFNALLKEMRTTTAQGQTKNDLTLILEDVLGSKLFKSLTFDVFESLDKEIEKITNVKPTTFAQLSDLEVLEESTTRETTIATINLLLEKVDALDTVNLDLVIVGQILNELKTNAYNGGTKDGVFDKIFANLIWYMTGDDIKTSGLYAGKTAFEKEKGDKAFETIRDYLKPESGEVDYYTVDYTAKFADLSNLVDFAKKMADAGLDQEITLTNPEDVQQVVADIKTSLENLELSKEEQIAVVDNMKNLLANQEVDILTEADKETFGDDFLEELDSNFDSEVADAIKQMLGLI